jgi:hypothetical protein
VQYSDNVLNKEAINMTQIPSLSVLVTRHGKKAVPMRDGEKVKFAPGSEFDRDNVDLSEEGKQEAFEQGKELLMAAPGYDHITVVQSDFLRCQTTSNKMLEGAGYDIEAGPSDLSVVLRKDISLIGVDWVAPEVPAYGKPSADGWVEAVLDQFYGKTEGRPELPNMAKFAASMLDSLVTGVAVEMDLGNQTGLAMVTTHGPVIDTLANPLYGSLVLNADGTHEVRNFPGHYGMGENISGALVPEESTKDNPVLLLDVKGKQCKYALDDLKRMRDQHYEKAEMPR